MSTPTLEDILLSLQLPEEWVIKLRNGTLSAHDIRQIYRLLKRQYINHPLFEQLMALLEEKHKELEGSLELDIAFDLARDDFEPER